MKVTSDFQPTSGTLVMYFQPDEDDRRKAERLKFKLVRPGASFVIGEYDVHPDVYALACLTILAPYTAKTLELDEPVTPGFRDLVQELLKIELTPVSESLEPRVMQVDAREAVSFSGGVDSVAAVRLLPSNSVNVFSHRMRPRTMPAQLYRDDAALHTCAMLGQEGRDVVVLSNTAEHARDPAGFSTDWTTVTGALLMANRLGIRSFNFGMIAEAAYRIGHAKFSDVADRGMFRDWLKLFAYLGLPLSLPTAGLSEVMTSRIALTDAANLEPQSCVRGLVSRPCNSCYKCFRKQLLTARLSGEKLEDEFFDNALQAKAIRRYLAQDEMHLENVIAYSIHGVASQHPLAEALRQKTRPLMDYADGLTLLERHYVPSLENVPDHLRGTLAQSIARYAEPMTDDQQRLVRNWDLTPVLGLDSRQSAHHDVQALLG
jgi:hypothetical protein